MDKDGTTSVSASVAVDPWLPDMSANGGTSDETVDAIMRTRFPGPLDLRRPCQRMPKITVAIRIEALSG